ncbi:DUF2742 domain-containing protein [Streptomyces sp. NPDC057148]|uniref:DUF2742 domain-containing protein n=1 Tax=unclassified Streptomyces TaxID=2593676 RepID=UPI00363BFD13
MTSRTRQDSPAARRGGAALRAVPDNADAGTITALRANAQVAALGVEEWPPYGSVHWLRLNPQDPRVYVATLEAAELHRTHVERIYADAHRQAQEAVRTAAEAREAAARTRTMRTREPHTLTPTPGWPPIAIPGCPGEFLTLETSE